PAQAAGRADGAALPDQRRVQAARPQERALPRLQEPDEASVRLREARPEESRQARLVARDLRLSAACGGEAASRLALSDLGESRNGARGWAIDARLDRERGRRGGAGVACGRTVALKPHWKPP